MTTTRIATRPHEGRSVPAWQLAPQRKRAGLAQWLEQRRGAQDKEQANG